MNPNFSQRSEAPVRRTQAENRAWRRRSLLDAAVKTVARFDITGATVERICAEAGASRGLIAHYFDSKEELLIAALTEWYDQSLGIKADIAQDKSLGAEEKIRRIAEATFEPPSYSWEIAAAWQAFTNASRHDPAYAGPIRDASSRSHEITEPLFEQAAKDRNRRLDARQAAVGLYVLDDGLWNSLATGKDDLTPAGAKKICNAYIDGCLT